MTIPDGVVSLELCEQLIDGGAILTLPAVPLERMLVGQLSWIRPGCVLAFPAFGEDVADVRPIVYDHLQSFPFGLAFGAGNRIRALLTPIEHAKVQDPADYRVAWSLWKEVHPMRRDLIDYLFATVARDDAALEQVRGNIRASL